MSAAARGALLLQLLHSQRETEDPDDMMRAATQALARYLKANRVGFFELVDEDTCEFTVCWTDGALPEPRGRWAVAKIGSLHVQQMRAGQAQGVGDTASDPLTRDSRFSQLGARSMISAPIVRGGRWRAGLYVNHSRPRVWSQDEVDIVREVAELTWDAIERARAIGAVRESEQRFREIADAAPVLIWMSDASSGCTWFNRPWLDFTGQPMEQQLGDGWTRNIHPDDVERCGETYRAAFLRRQSFRMDYRLRRHDGEWRIVDDIGVPRFAGDGTFMGYIGSCLDVTDQRSVQRALRESEERLRLATDAAEIGLWDVDVVNNTLFWPARVKALLGFAPEQSLSMEDFYQTLHPDDRPAVRAAFAACLDPQTRPPYDVEYRLLDPATGAERWIAAKGRAIFDEAGVCRRVMGIATDITQRKQNEERLRELNDTLERRVAAALAERKVLADIVEAADTFVQVMDHDYRWLAINRAAAGEFERLFGLRPRPGQTLTDALAGQPRHIGMIKPLWARALSGEQFTTTVTVHSAQDELRFYDMRFNPLLDRDGKVAGAYQFCVDVTDRRRSEARLAEAEEHLRQAQKIEAIGQLTGGVAHDFNNLLMVISGGLSLLDRSQDETRRRSVIEGMRQAVQRGAALSRQLLGFARRRPLNPEPLNLARRIERMRELLDRSLRGDVTVETDFAPDLWPAKVDPAEFELAVLNLCVNARDAMPRGGVITMAAHNVPGLQRRGLQGDFVCLTVSDSGTGMSKEVLARVFEPFFTTKEVGKGSGLGLPQVYGFAQQSGGAVEIDSTPGQGTAVTLLLPRSLTQPAVAEPAAANHDAARHPKRAAAGAVLLVEDDAEVAALVGEMLSLIGYEVTHVGSAQAALGALANARAIDVVFSDIVMPGGMNGVELAREIRRRRPGLPIVLTSGYTDGARPAAELGIELLAKPYTIEQLAAALGRAVAGPGVADDERGLGGAPPTPAPGVGSSSSPPN